LSAAFCLGFLQQQELLNCVPHPLLPALLLRHQPPLSTMAEYSYRTRKRSRDYSTQRKRAEEFCQLTLKYTNQYLSIADFNDKGTGASKDCALFDPIFLNTSSNSDGLVYFGQVFSDRRYDKPTKFTVVCSGAVGDALARPMGFELVWNDKGTGASDDRSIWKPMPPPGYVCCGHVGKGRKGYSYSNKNTPSSSTFPDYRCVRRDLCYRKDWSDCTSVWTDRGSRAKKNVEVREIVIGRQHFSFAYCNNDGSSYPEVWVLKQLFYEKGKKITDMHITLTPLVRVLGNSKGCIKKTVTVKRGFKNFRENKTEFELSVKASMGGAWDVFTASLDMEMRTKMHYLNQFTYEEETTETVQEHIDLSEPCFKYQIKMTGTYDGRYFSGTSDGTVYSAKPLMNVPGAYC